MPNVTGGNRSTFGGSARAQNDRNKERNAAGSTSGRMPDAVIGGKAVTIGTEGDRLTTTPSRISKTEAGQGGGQPAGGTATTNIYEPGAVPNFPDADTLTVLENIVGKAVPVVGSVISGGQMVKGLLSDDGFSGPSNLLGGDPGQQQGYQRDRSRGASSFNPNDPRGTSADEREIQGRPYGAGTLALTGDPEDAGGVGGGTPEYSDDIMLKDRRKPRVGAGTQMLLA